MAQARFLPQRQPRRRRDFTVKRLAPVRPRSPSDRRAAFARGTSQSSPSLAEVSPRAPFGDISSPAAPGRSRPRQWGRTRMRRVAAWTCVIAATAAVAACGFIRWPLSAARVGDELNAAFAAPSGLRWRQPDAVSFTVLPWPSLHVFGARPRRRVRRQPVLRSARAARAGGRRPSARSIRPRARSPRHSNRDARFRPAAIRRSAGGFGRSGDD